MPPKRKSGFFSQIERPEDEAARQREVESLLSTRRTFPQEIGVERIAPNPYQARRDFVGLDELAEGIRAQGFISRLRVRPDPQRAGFFQLVYGERRLRAAQLAGLGEIPCDVAEHTDDEMIEIGLAENIQPRDLNPLEEARAFQTFIDERGYSIRRLAERIGKDKGYIEDRLALLRAPEDVQQLIAERPDALRMAREIAKIENIAERQSLIADVLLGRVNTLEVRQAVREQILSPITQRSSRNLVPTASSLQRQIERDANTMRIILERWTELAVVDDAAGEQIAAHAEAMLLKFQTLITTLER